MLLGLIVGVPLTLMSTANTTLFSADRTTSLVWLIGLFLLWGYAHNYAYNRLVYPHLPQSANAEADATVQNLDRRRFLITLGSSAAAITVVGGGFVRSPVVKAKSAASRSRPIQPPSLTPTCLTRTRQSSPRRGRARN